MKRFNVLIGTTILVYVCLALLLFGGSTYEQNHEDMGYKVEIHDVMRKLRQGMEAADLDLSESRYLRAVSFLPKENEGGMEAFCDSRNGLHSSIRPLVTEGNVKGYVRFDYVTEGKDRGFIWAAEGILLLAFVFVLGMLLYIKIHILQPFHVLSEIPYELSKGHLSIDPEENRNRFFGRFLWGLAMLRDHLSDAKAKELKLLKEKKLLLLSISHDIKIPLSAIKLYARALKEEIYESDAKRHEAAEQIEVHVREIEDFVREIISASSEEILSIEVVNSEFYLKDFVEKIRDVYEPKAKVILTELLIGDYENRLLKGDMERAFEVMENLLENAFKYGDGRTIAIDFYEEDYCQVIRVFNTGAVVTDTELPHLFDSFYRGSNVTDKPGNGLGLYISRQIMNKMDGEIFAERKENGMSFCMVFRL